MHSLGIHVTEQTCQQSVAELVQHFKAGHFYYKIARQKMSDSGNQPNSQIDWCRDLFVENLSEPALILR